MLLPATAMFQFILEVAAAYGGQSKGVASYRLLFPALLLLLNAGVWILLAASGGVSAAFCYGAAWLVAIALLYLTTQSYVPAPVWQAKALREPGVLIRGALPMAAGSLVLAMLAQTGVIILDQSSRRGRGVRLCGSLFRREPSWSSSPRPPTGFMRQIFSLSPAYMHFTNRDRIVLPAFLHVGLGLFATISSATSLRRGTSDFRNSCHSPVRPRPAEPPRRTYPRAPTGWHPEAAPRRRPCRSPGLGSTVSPSLTPPRCWHSRD